MAAEDGQTPPEQIGVKAEPPTAFALNTGPPTAFATTLGTASAMNISTKYLRG